MCVYLFASVFFPLLFISVRLSSISAVSGGSLCVGAENCFLSDRLNNRSASAAQTQDRLNPSRPSVSQYISLPAFEPACWTIGEISQAVQCVTSLCADLLS